MLIISVELITSELEVLFQFAVLSRRSFKGLYQLVLGLLITPHVSS